MYRTIATVRGCLYRPAFPGRDVKRDDFDVLKYVTVHDSAIIYNLQFPGSSLLYILFDSLERRKQNKFGKTLQITKASRSYNYWIKL